MFFGYSRSCFLENAWKQLQVELVDKAGNYLQQLRPQMGGLGAQGSKSSMDPALASQEVGYNLRGSRSFSPVTGWWFRTFGL